MSTPQGGTRELVLASAGSGKTFRISSRIIGLLARGAAPGSIFASTFTRKAAGEILDRVLLRLARASTDAGVARELALHALELDEDEAADYTPEHWQPVLRRTLVELHRLDVGTLDAFFVRALKGFSHDLGLPPGWGIADEPASERLRSEALQEFLGALDGGALAELIRSLHAGDVKRSVHDALHRDVDKILAAHLQLDPSAPGWGAMAQVAPPPPADPLEQARELAEAMARAPVPSKGDGTPDGRWVKARDRAADLVALREWDTFLASGLGSKALDVANEGGEISYYSKPASDELAQALEGAVELAREEIGARLAARGLAMGRLAETYQDAYLNRLVQAGLLRFDDITRLLAGLGIPATGLPDEDRVGGRGDLFYRLDGATRHVLLDEFQDTSLLQWAALEPVLDRLAGAGEGHGAVSGGEGQGLGAAVVVADPKQSIYGWRGAAPVVVDALGERYDLPRETLPESWRSSKEVLDAVNRVFGQVERAPVLERDPRDAAVAAEWRKAFDAHRPARRDPPLPGRVRLLEGPQLDGPGNDQPEFFRFAAAHIAHLHRSAPGHSIGVLVRVNDTVARLIYELGKLGVPASEEGGASLLDSAPVVSLLALLRLADHPGDRLARYHVARTPVGALVGMEDEADGRRAARVSHRLRERLMREGYGPLLRELAVGLSDHCTARERDRLRRLVEVGFRWDESQGGPGLRVGEFVRQVEAERAESAGGDPVRIMTIHGSKGLEFDAVVLPELHGGSFSPRWESRPLVRRGDGGTGPITHAFPPLNTTAMRLFGDAREIREAEEQTRAAATRDSLSLLYVAMTRARYALDMLIPGEKETGQARTHARLLREVLPLVQGEEGAVTGEPALTETGARVLYDQGDEDWMDRAPRKSSLTTETLPAAPVSIPLRTPGGRLRNLERRTPSGAEGEGRIHLDYLLGLAGGGDARSRGTVIHAWLESLEWMEEGLPAEEALLRTVRAAAPGLAPDTARSWLAWLRERLESEEVREILSRAHWPEGSRVERELPFLIRQGDALVEGIVDRLVLETEGGAVARAHVLDYKTDAVDPAQPGALEERVAHYAPQIRAYREAVAKLYGLEPSEVTGRLLFLDPGAVVSVE